MASDDQRDSKRHSDARPPPSYSNITEASGNDSHDTRPATETTTSQSNALPTATLPGPAPAAPTQPAPHSDAASRPKQSRLDRELESTFTSRYIEPLGRRRKSGGQETNGSSSQPATPADKHPSPLPAKAPPAARPRARVTPTPQPRPATKPPAISKAAPKAAPKTALKQPVRKETLKETVNMPPVTNKRVKERRVSRNIIIGSEATDLPPVGDPKRDPSIPEQHTKRWSIYIRHPEGQPDMRTWLNKVTFKIHPDYSPSLRAYENPPYEITETGWGGFQVDIRLFFQPVSNEKPQYRNHFLQLEPYGDEAAKEKQKREGFVRSELLEVVEFNEPLEAFYQVLTSEQQFDYLKDAKQCAAQWGAHIVKGKKKAISPSEGSAQLPVSSSGESLATQDQEEGLRQQMLKRAAELDKMYDEEMVKKAAITERLRKLRLDLGPEAAAQATKEASGDRVRRR
ncbi:yeats-domain-containing protein [Lophium mytilinum]|uniref:Protein AF-9 homolog n=1 Tax=Lophium mytilinum TaxID=390894 RepID=A0A6A6QKL9_9PEZI|nr:yeats-domain-containing protein [Lophium mytilinum]